MNAHLPPETLLIKLAPETATENFLSFLSDIVVKVVDSNWSANSSNSESASSSSDLKIEKHSGFKYGRDENISKMDVDRRPGGRPVEKLSLVDVDQLKTSVVDVDQ